MKRILKKLLLIAGVLVVALVLLVAGYILFGPWYAAELEIGPETTVVEGPLREDGTVDYVAAMNEMAGQGMPPEDNAFAVIAELIDPATWQAFSQADDAERHRLETFQLLGVPMPDDGPYFVPIDIHAERRAARDDRWAEGADADQPVWQQQWERAQEKPWSAADAPLVAEWLEQQKPTLAALSEGMTRPGYWPPYVFEEKTIPRPGMAVRSVGKVSRALRARAMRRLAGSDLDGAIEDVLTLKRLAWHHRETLSIIKQLRGSATSFLTREIIEHVAAHPALTTRQARELQATLADREGRFTLDRAIDVGERFMLLNDVQVVLTGQRWSDPNRALRQANVDFDRLVRAVSAPTRAERMNKSDEIRRDVEQRKQRTRTDLIAELLPAIKRPLTAADLTEMEERLERVALAVAGYRAEHGEYTASLDDLVPEWMDAVPVDIFDEAEQPVRYAVEEDRVVVYSVGPNGEDNGGVDGHGRWDEGDLVIQWQR